MTNEIPAIVLPMAHLNGTGKNGLYGQICNNTSAIRNAIFVMEQSRPHMRDYYLYGALADEIFRTATARHNSRIARLQEVLTECEEVADAFAEKNF
jgi:hypothetical protein